jgi:hypothetical protein
VLIGHSTCEVCDYGQLESSNGDRRASVLAGSDEVERSLEVSVAVVLGKNCALEAYATALGEPESTVFCGIAL